MKCEEREEENVSVLHYSLSTKSMVSHVLEKYWKETSWMRENNLHEKFTTKTYNLS